VESHEGRAPVLQTHNELFTTVVSTSTTEKMWHDNIAIVVSVQMTASQSTTVTTFTNPGKLVGVPIAHPITGIFTTFVCYFVIWHTEFIGYKIISLISRYDESKVALTGPFKYVLL